jgi:hypothetical protein
MIILLNTSNRRKYCTIKIQINNQYKAEFDCLKDDPIDQVLKKAAEAFKNAEANSKSLLFSIISNPDELEKRLQQIKNQKKSEDNTTRKIENMFTISNITKGGLSNNILNDYVMKMNDTTIGKFQHDRNKGLSECLLAAAESIDDFESSKLLTTSLFYNKKKNITSKP